MALVFPDRIKFSSTTTGTGAITVGSAVTGYIVPASGVTPVGSTVRYVIEDGASWEIGLGTLTSLTVMARTTVQYTSAGNATPLTLSGKQTCFFTFGAADAVSAMDKPVTATQFNAAYMDAYYGGSTTISIPNQTYTTIVCSTENADAGACYNTTTGIYTFPFSGKFGIDTRVRMDDSAGSPTYSPPNCSYGQGFGTTLGDDGVTFLWGQTCVTPTLGSGIGRNMLVNRRVIIAAAGAKGSLFTYVDGGANGMCVKRAQLTVTPLSVP